MATVIDRGVLMQHLLGTPRFYCDRARHLVCKPYLLSGLHLMAAELGIKRCWFHGGKHPHYDIPKRRVDEIKAKCHMVSTRELLKIIREGQQ